MLDIPLYLIDRFSAIHSGHSFLDKRSGSNHPVLDEHDISLKWSRKRSAPDVAACIKRSGRKGPTYDSTTCERMIAWILCFTMRAFAGSNPHIWCLKLAYTNRTLCSETFICSLCCEAWSLRHQVGHRHCSMAACLDRKQHSSRVNIESSQRPDKKKIFCHLYNRGSPAVMRYIIHNYQNLNLDFDYYTFAAFSAYHYESKNNWQCHQ